MYRGTFEAISNREAWSESFIVTDDNGSPLNIAAASISVAVRDQLTKRVILTGTNGDGHVTFPGGGTDGAFTWTFSGDEVRKLCAATYDIGASIAVGGVPSQILIMTLPVLDGVLA